MQRERIVWLVAQHMRLASVPEMTESKRRRFVREEGFDELLELGRLDCMASHGDLSTIERIDAYRTQLPPEEARPVLLLRGSDLLAMGYSEGPLIGHILHAVEDEQLEGNLADSNAARAYVRGHWPRMQGQ